MKEGAIRVAMQAASTRSRQTSIPGRESKTSEREVGILNACIAGMTALQSSLKVIQEASPYLQLREIRELRTA